jgi:hypothetical protein
MRLTASCEIMVRNVSRAGGSVAVEITQAKASGEEVTTLLLCPDRARELASALLRHCGDARAEVPGAETRRGLGVGVHSARLS